MPMKIRGVSKKAEASNKTDSDKKPPSEGSKTSATSPKLSSDSGKKEIQDPKRKDMDSKQASGMHTKDSHAHTKAPLFDDASDGSPILSTGTSPVITGANFDPNIAYRDEFMTEEMSFSSLRLNMNPELKGFLVEVAKFPELYCESILALNGITAYKD